MDGKAALLEDIQNFGLFIVLAMVNLGITLYIIVNFNRLAGGTTDLWDWWILILVLSMFIVSVWGCWRIHKEIVTALEQLYDEKQASVQSINAKN